MHMLCITAGFFFERVTYRGFIGETILRVSGFIPSCAKDNTLDKE